MELNWRIDSSKPSTLLRFWNIQRRRTSDWTTLLQDALTIGIISADRPPACDRSPVISALKQHAQRHIYLVILVLLYSQMTCMALIELPLC